MTGTTIIQIRPSDERRNRLKEADSELGNGRGVPLVSNFFPIERYYDAADKVCSYTIILVIINMMLLFSSRDLT